MGARYVADVMLSIMPIISQKLVRSVISDNNGSGMMARMLAAVGESFCSRNYLRSQWLCAAHRHTHAQLPHKPVSLLMRTEAGSRSTLSLSSLPLSPHFQTQTSARLLGQQQQQQWRPMSIHDARCLTQSCAALQHHRRWLHNGLHCLLGGERRDEWKESRSATNCTRSAAGVGTRTRTRASGSLDETSRDRSQSVPTFAFPFPSTSTLKAHAVPVCRLPYHSNTCMNRLLCTLPL